MISLERAFTKLGVTSRKVAHGWILDKRVQVNSEIQVNPYTFVDLEKDRIALDGKELAPVEKITVIMNKPAGYLTAHRDHRSRPLVYSLLDPELPHLNAIGRLDFNTEGLLLFTNDGALFEQLTNPANAIRRTYEVTTDAPLSESHMNAICTGLMDRGEFLKAESLRKIAEKKYEIILTEGKYREVRRLFKACGATVENLKRTSFGDYTLDNLATGEIKIILKQKI